MNQKADQLNLKDVLSFKQGNGETKIEGRAEPTLFQRVMEHTSSTWGHVLHNDATLPEYLEAGAEVAAVVGAAVIAKRCGIGFPKNISSRGIPDMGAAAGPAGFVVRESAEKALCEADTAPCLSAWLATARSSPIASLDHATPDMGQIDPMLLTRRTIRLSVPPERL